MEGGGGGEEVDSKASQPHGVRALTNRAPSRSFGYASSGRAEADVYSLIPGQARPEDEIEKRTRVSRLTSKRVAISSPRASAPPISPPSLSLTTTFSYAALQPYIAPPHPLNHPFCPLTCSFPPSSSSSPPSAPQAPCPSSPPL